MIMSIIISMYCCVLLFVVVVSSFYFYFYVLVLVLPATVFIIYYDSGRCENVSPPNSKGSQRKVFQGMRIKIQLRWLSDQGNNLALQCGKIMTGHNTNKW